MAKAAVTTFIVDLKLTPDNQVRILEFGRGFDSAGYEGYKHATGENPLTRHVGPFYKRTFDLPVIHSVSGFYDRHPHFGIDGRETMNTVFMKEPKADFDPDSIATYSAMILSHDPPKQIQHASMEKNNLAHVLLHDGNSTACASYENKAVFAAVMKEHLGNLLPAQKIYSCVHGQFNVLQILEDFPGHEEIILKVPEDCGGHGIFVADRGFLRLHGNAYLKLGALTDRGTYFQAFRRLLPHLTYPGLYKLAKSPVKNVGAAFAEVTGALFKDVPVMVAQERILGKPVDYKNKAYDSTIRIIATAWHDKGETHVVCHDGYHKIPKSPIGKGSLRGQSVSKINHARLPWNKIVESVVLADADKEIIFPQLEEGLKRAFHHVFTVSSAGVIKMLLQDDNPATRIAGWKMLTNDRYNNIVEADIAGLKQAVCALSRESPQIARIMSNDIIQGYYHKPSFDRTVSGPVQDLWLKKFDLP
jgi:hypothetical protein